MNRTGSIGSASPRPRPRTRDARRGQPPRRGDGSLGPARAGRARSSTMTEGSASRPAPESPPASRPSSGGTTVTPRGPEDGQVVLDGRVLPHLGVHGRAHHHRRRRGDQRGGQQVVGEPAGVAGQEVGGGRGHHDRGRPAGPAGCGGWPRPRPTGSSGPAPSRGRRRWPGPRTGWPARSAPGPHGRRRRPAGGRPRRPCRRRCPPTPRGPRTGLPRAPSSGPTRPLPWSPPRSTARPTRVALGVRPLLGGLVRLTAGDRPSLARRPRPRPRGGPGGRFGQRPPLRGRDGCRWPCPRPPLRRRSTRACPRPRPPGAAPPRRGPRPGSCSSCSPDGPAGTPAPPG